MMNVVRPGALDGCTGLPKNLVSAWLGRKLAFAQTVRPHFPCGIQIFFTVASAKACIQPV